MGWQCDKVTHLTKEQADELYKRTATARRNPKLRCVRLVAEDNQHLLNYAREFLHYDQHGVLPVSGGLYDQDARWVAAMDVLRPILHERSNLT